MNLSRLRPEPSFVLLQKSNAHEHHDPSHDDENDAADEQSLDHRFHGPDTVTRFGAWENVSVRLLAVLVAAALFAGCSSEADFSGAIETEILPAEHYQQEIASIDRLLFREEALGEEGVRELENVIAGLSTRVGAYSDSKFVKIESLELKLLAKKAGRLSPRGTGQALQNDWMRLRNNLFDDRSWFVRSAADLEYAASVVPPPHEAPSSTSPP